MMLLTALSHIRNNNIIPLFTLNRTRP